MSDQLKIIDSQIRAAILRAPLHDSKLVYIAHELDQMFDKYDWTKSFSNPQVIVYDESVTSEIIIAIHHWLRRQCADISNITLITTHNLGIASWWEQYCAVMGQQSFLIQEKFFTHSDQCRARWFDKIPPLPDRGWFANFKKIERVFSYYGGSYGKLERQYLILKMLELSSVGEIDYLGKFVSKDSLLGYSENINYYLDQNEIDQLNVLYDRHVSVTGDLAYSCVAAGIKNEKLDYQGVQWQTDSKCFASVVRETVLDDVYSCVTEKTLRAFLHHTVVIPVTFQGVTELERMGFWFPHDIFDYSYQTESRFAYRTKHMITSIKQLIANLSIGDMQQYYTDNIDKFHANAKLVHIYINDYTINKEQL